MIRGTQIVKNEMPESARPRIVPPRLSIASVAREATGLLELPKLALELRRLRGEPRGSGAAVLVFPGFGANDRTTWPLRQFLNGQGHRARGWGLGANVQDVPETLERAGALTQRWAERAGGPISLVGWSLGGYLAREVARDHPHSVRRVVTLGSPVIGGPNYTTVASIAARRGWDVDVIERQVEERKQIPLEVPVTAVYSRSDGVVSWRACIDSEDNGSIEHVEVDATHLGLGFSADVFRIVARRLAADNTEAVA